MVSIDEDWRLKYVLQLFYNCLVDFTRVKRIWNIFIHFIIMQNKKQENKFIPNQWHPHYPIQNKKNVSAGFNCYKPV